MSIKEKLAKEDGMHIYCYQQGAFWVCYEQSAYIVSLSKAYKPSKKWIKNRAQEVVTIGFPNTALQQWVHEQSVKPPATARLYPVAIPNNTCHAEFISASHPNPASAELVSVFQHLIKKSKKTLTLIPCLNVLTITTGFTYLQTNPTAHYTLALQEV
jgi:hypothetical protein